MWQHQTLQASCPFIRSPAVYSQLWIQLSFFSFFFTTTIVYLIENPKFLDRRIHRKLTIFIWERANFVSSVVLYYVGYYYYQRQCVFNVLCGTNHRNRELQANKNANTDTGQRIHKRDGVSILVSRNTMTPLLISMMRGRSCRFFALFIFALNLSSNTSVSTVPTKLPTAITTSKIPQTTTW